MFNDIYIQSIWHPVAKVNGDMLLSKHFSFSFGETMHLD